MTNEFDRATGMPVGSKAERTFWYGHDTILLKNISSSDKFAIIEKEEIFKRNSGKSRALQTNAFPLESGRIAQILGLRVDHNITFADDRQLAAFEQYAMIDVEVEDKSYSPIPILDLLPYNRTVTGGKTSYRELLTNIPNVATDPTTPETNDIWYNTTTGLLKVKIGSAVKVIPQTVAENFNVLALNGKYKALFSPIVPPHDGKIEFDFDPLLKGIKTADATIFGTTFGKGIVDDANTPVFYIKVSWFGEIIRRTN